MSVARPVVIDTNVVLDLYLFDDPAVAELRALLVAGSVQWLATVSMRDELARVLGYPNVASWLGRRGKTATGVAIDVLARFDGQARIVDPAPLAPLACVDPDDQPFIDLAFAHGADLVSKDRMVIDAWRRLARDAAHAMKLPPLTSSVAPVR